MRSVDHAKLGLARIVSGTTLSLLLLISTSLPARATAPANDVCANAVLIPPWAGATNAYLTVGTDITFATEAGDPINSCQTNVAKGIWYTFTPEATAFYTISTCPEAAPEVTVLDTVMAIYTSSANCAGPFTEIPESDLTAGCADDSCGPGTLHAAITTLLTADTHYYILVWHYRETPTSEGNSTIQLQVKRSLFPANDMCAMAKELFLNVPELGSTIGATNDYQLASAACFSTGIGNTVSTNAGRDVVFSFLAPAAGKYSFKVFNYNDANDLVVYVATNCPSGTRPVIVNSCVAAANRSSVSSSEEVMCVPLAANQRAYIFVDEDTFTLGSSFRIEVTECIRETEPNNTIATAGAVFCGIEGSINPNTDVDIFALGIFPAGSRAFVLLDASAANRTDFDLRIITAADTLEYDESDNDAAFGSFAPNVTGTLLKTVPTYIRVNYRGAGVAAEPYRIYAVVQPDWNSATPENEPNNTKDQPNAVAENNYYRGALTGPAPSKDVDWYQFTAESGELIFMGLDGDPLRDNTPINAKLELLDSAGNVIVGVNDAGPPSPAPLSSTNVTAGSTNAITPYSPGEALVYRVKDDGVYYARVSIGTTNAGTIGAGDYLLSITKNCVSSLVHGDSARFKSIARLANDHILLQLQGTPGATYRILTSPDLRYWAPWPGGTRTADTNGLFQVEDTTSPLWPKWFYRAVWP